MSHAPLKIKTPYEKWQDTINLAKTDRRWNEHVELLRKPGPAGRPGEERWQVIGQRSEAEQQAGRLDDALACSPVPIK
jgi:hypothetical protein